MTQAQAEKKIQEIAVTVGEILGHVRRTAEGADKVTPMTAINSYIVPDAISSWFEKRKLRVPQWLPKARASDSDGE